MSKYKLDLRKYAGLARQTAAEGCVLIKNDNRALPLRKGDKVALLGRIAATYYKSGMGSGGMVNTAYVVGIPEALYEEEDIYVEKKVRGVYDEWISEHPFDHGEGWGRIPRSQKEMPVTDELKAASSGCNVGLAVIGRTAGEDLDNKLEKGSFLLTDAEEVLLDYTCRNFEHSIVVLNVSNIIDMSWVEKYNPEAVLYAWQGGQEGGHGVADVLMGRVNPCGKLTDTIAKDPAGYPSTPYFGDTEKNYYVEDIYVGYRYFETFEREKVLYPFGFGKSYTRFDISGVLSENTAERLRVLAKVKNIGDRAGKEVVQVYLEAPQGKIGKPSRVLVGFAKTKELEPMEEEELTIDVAKSYYASFDDSGITGAGASFVLEEGTYSLYLGGDVRTAGKIAEFFEEFRVTEHLSQALMPVEKFERFSNRGGKLEFEAVPLKNVSSDCFAICSKQEEKYDDKAGNKSEGKSDDMSGDKCDDKAAAGASLYKLCDVYNGNVTLDIFVKQLSQTDLIQMSRGEGMCSPKVTPGTAAAFGGITERLRELGIPALCATDGPSGIRMDCGTKAFSLPNGTLMGCTFDVNLIEELYTMTGRELRQNRIDTLLGPGINIHRNPLNGRNFEYISEDPLLTGKMGAAQILGMSKFGSTGTAKHFITNNQETNRRSVNAVVSARALREIYLKGFEIAIKEGNCRSIMTTYGPLNGLWTAGTYELNTQVLRNEWGFDGIVMTDWWAGANDEGQPLDMKNHAAMLNAGNDLFMVCADTTVPRQDNIEARIESGELKLEQLVKNAKNILNFALKSVAMEYEMGLIGEEELKERREAQAQDDIIPEDIEYFDIEPEGEINFDGTEWSCRKDDKYIFAVKSLKPGLFDIELTAGSSLDELAQIPVTITLDGMHRTMFSFRGTGGEFVSETHNFGLLVGNYHFLKIAVGADGLKIRNVKLKYREEFKWHSS